MSSVLVIKLGALGDIVVATAALRRIQACHGDEHTWLLTGREYASLFHAWPGLNVQALPRRGLRAAVDTIAWIRSHRFARLYDLQSSERTAVYCALSGVPERVGIHNRFPYTHHPPCPWRGEGHIYDRHMEVLRSAGIDPQHPLPSLPASPAELAELDAWQRSCLPEGRPFVLLHAGASPRHPGKRWPHFGPLAQALRGARLLPVWVGGREDVEVSRALARHCGIDATARFSLPQLAELGRRARFAVTNDSGPMHVLSCSGVPVYGLFGPTDWRRHHAIGQRERVIAAGADTGGFRPAPIADLRPEWVLARLRADGLLEVKTEK